MAAVTWQNIAPSNPSGILNAVNTSGKQIGTGISGIGDAFNQFAEDKTKIETDSFINTLMGTESEADRQQLIKGADTSFLDMARISEANTKAGKDAKDFGIWKDKQAILQEDALELAGVKKDKKDKKDPRIDFVKDLTAIYGEGVTEPAGLGGFGQTPANEAMDILDSYAVNNGLSNAERARMYKIVTPQLRYSDLGLNEFDLGNDDVSSASDDLISSILAKGGFLRDKDIPEK